MPIAYQGFSKVFPKSLGNGSLSQEPCLLGKGKTMPYEAKPEVVVNSDYEGYFENLVRSWIDKHQGPFAHRTISISSGPWRAYAVKYEKMPEDRLHLDFYSAVRAGFGSISQAEVDQIIAML